jgi:repressor LexA
MENIEGSIIIDPAFMKKSESCFSLKVKGDSMTNVGIFEGDLVIVLPANAALNGDIVVAMLDDEVTVKTFEQKNDRMRLLPQNDNYQPIEINESKEFKIVGKVTGIVRWLN